jgi:hypothetical protein
MITVEQGVAFACDRIPADDPLRALRLANVATDILVSNMVTRSGNTGATEPVTTWSDDEYSYRVAHPAGVTAYYEVDGDGVDTLVNVTTPTLEVK